MKQKLMSLLFCGVIAIASYAQNGLFEKWSIGLNAGLYGYGIQGATSLSPNFQARAGFDYMTFSYNDALSFSTPELDTPDIKLKGELSEAKLTFPNFKAMVDYYPVKNGIFSITAGFYIGNNRITFDGQILDYGQYSSHPKFGFEDIIIQPDIDGNFDFKLKMGSTIKPYFGLGLGKTIPKSRVGFRFELGVVYQGGFKVESNNVVSADGLDRINEGLFDKFDDLPVSKEILKLWPMMNFTLSYRIH